jgi:hypothetical protein
MTQCPKCNSVDIMAPLRVISSGAGHPFVQITEPRTSGLQIRSSETAELKVAICSACGHVEHFTDDAQRLWKYWQKGYR